MEFTKETKKSAVGFSSGKIIGTGDSEREYREIEISAETLVKGENSAYKGIGCISGNNSSRLLLDYKALHPKIYNEILRLLFEKGYGAELSHIKLEFGADVNSSSGTEPSTMRNAHETPDVTRGAGFIFAADALKINPELTVDLLRWGEPAWVKSAFEISRRNGFEARYKWYVDTIDEAYAKLGIKFTHISPDANETGDADEDWIIYFAERLKSEKNKPYDYSRIKIVASDEVVTRTIAAKMTENERLRNCVDVIELHYTTYGDENTERLFKEYSKEIWYSEGIAPSCVSRLSFKKNLSGLSGRNGAVDTANRIINGWCHGRMTMYEFQPAVSAYYDGSCYYPKHIIKANEPWSGHYEVESGFYMAMHFTRFVGKNWYPVGSASFGDGEENHYIENTTSNYITFMPESRSNFTMIFTNDSTKSRYYHISFKDCDFSGRRISFVETAPPDLDEAYNKGWFRLRKTCEISGNTFEVRIRPDSIVTATTLDTDFVNGTETIKNISPLPSRLTLPYRDNFTYPEKDDDFLSGRGGAPLFTTDQGSAFEVVRCDGENWLEQKITEDIIPENWRFRGTPQPITCLGDDSWANYTVQIKVKLSSGDCRNYAGIGVRYNSAVACEVTSNCGLAVKIFADGRWEMLFMDDTVKQGKIKSFDSNAAHTIAVSAIGNLYVGYLDGEMIGSFTEKDAMQAGGRAALLSGYYKNRFTDLEIEPIPAMNRYITACDALEPEMRYFGDAELFGMESYKYSNRTCSVLHTESGFTLSYEGCGFALCGTAEKAAVRIEFDGKILAANREVGGSKYRQAFYRCDSCKFGSHTIKVTVIEGEIILDSVAVYTDVNEYAKLIMPSENAEGKSSEGGKPAAAAALGAASLLIAGRLISRKKRRK